MPLFGQRCEIPTGSWKFAPRRQGPRTAKGRFNGPQRKQRGPPMAICQKHGETTYDSFVWSFPCPNWSAVKTGGA